MLRIKTELEFLVVSQFSATRSSDTSICQGFAALSHLLRRPHPDEPDLQKCVFESLRWEITICGGIVSFGRRGNSTIEPCSVLLLGVGMGLAAHLLLPASVLLPTGLWLPTELLLSALVLCEFMLLGLRSPSMRYVSLRPHRLRRFVPSWLSDGGCSERVEFTGSCQEWVAANDDEGRVRARV